MLPVSLQRWLLYSFTQTLKLVQVSALGLERCWKYVWTQLSTSEIDTHSSTTVVSSEPDAVVQYPDRFVQSALYSLKMQAVSCAWVQTPLSFRGDVTFIFASFSAGYSECNTCTTGIAALKPGQAHLHQGAQESADWTVPSTQLA